MEVFMKKILILIVIILIAGVSVGCLSGKDIERARRYNLEYVYIEDQLELKEEPYTKKFNFRAKKNIEKRRFSINLVYFHFKNFFTKVNEEHQINIYKSLIGISYAIYDKTHNELVFSHEISDIHNDVWIRTDLPGICLYGDVEIKKNVNYEMVVTLPSKKDTQKQYLRPIFVVGVMEKGLYP
jgi:hypothetical protein